MTSIGNIASRWRPSHFIRIFGLILALSLFVGAGAIIGYRYQDVLDDARRDAANFSFALAQEMERSFQTVDMVLNRVQFETGGLGPWLGAGRTHMAAFPEGGSVKTGVTR
jgi:hypothetical protein